MLREALATLTDKQKAQLRYAFEHDLSEHILLSGGKFIGVNVEHNGNLIILDTNGVWSYGEVKNG
jgi:hypothetical protein